MLKIKSLTNRIFAMFLIMALLCPNFAFVSKSYAASVYEMIFDATRRKIANENVKFDAYFETSDSKAYIAKQAIDDSSIDLIFDLSLADEGYLKDAKITLIDENDSSSLAFDVAGNVEESEYIQEFSDNVLLLKQISKRAHVKLNLPLTYIQKEFIDESQMSQWFRVVLSGVYVNEKAEETPLEKEQVLELEWKDERKIEIASEITKYISYSQGDTEGVILQTLVRINSNPEKFGAVKSTKIEVEVPSLGAGEIKSIDVTNSEWNYEDGILTIEKENEKQKVLENIDSKNSLKEGITKQVEKYYCDSGQEEFLITYKFENVSLKEQKIEYKVKANMVTVGKEDIQNIFEKEFSYDVSNQIGNTISYQLKNETENISKLKTYLNYKNENIEQNILKTKQIINISNCSNIDELVITNKDDYYIDKNQIQNENKDIVYKSISVNKDEFNRILGEDGFVEIQDSGGDVIGVIDKQAIEDEFGNYILSLERKNLSNLNIRISKPKEDGNLTLNIERKFEKVSYNKDLFKEFESILSEFNLEARFNNEKILEQSNKVETKLKDTITDVDLELSTEQISTQEPTQLEMKIKLNNNETTSDLFGNSYFEIKLPDGVEKVELKDYSIIYGDELNLGNVDTGQNENGIWSIKINLDGDQTRLNTGQITNGTNINLLVELTLNKFLPTQEKEIILNFSNEEATTYKDDGIITKKIKYSSPNGIISINNIRNYEESGKVLTSVEQGEVRDKIKNSSQELNPTMELLVVNNNENPISDLKILGRIPFKDNKDILNGTDLETTKDSRLITLINQDEANKERFKIYYSANKEANENLDDEENGWTENLSLDEIKSYLIVPEDTNYELKGSEAIKFDYGFNIPDNLDYNENFVGTFATYYKELKDEVEHEEISTPDLVYLTTGNQDEQEEQEDLNVTESNLVEESEPIDALVLENETEENLDTGQDSIEESLVVEEKVDNSQDSNRNKILGTVWIDENLNGIKESKEKTEANIKVILAESGTGLIKQTTTTNEDGKYNFDGIENGNYFVVFDYDNIKYNLSQYQQKDTKADSNSDVVKTEIEQDGKKSVKAITDNIEVKDKDLLNINMGLQEVKTFDLALTKTIDKITVQNEQGTVVKNYEDATLAKFEIDAKDIDSSIVHIEYTITVENKGEIPGYAKSIVDYIPEDIIFNSSLNPDWYSGEDGNLYTKALANKILEKGEKAKVKLVLTKKMTEDNIGLINNTAEIYEDYNTYGLEDINSKVANKIQNENDFGTTDALISLKTGKVFIYTSVMFTSTLLCGIAISIAMIKLRKNIRKEGV